MTQFIFEKHFEVRDYELDLQGVVNNAVYNNYMEHTRHTYLKSIGLDFEKLHKDGIDAVVIKAETEYKAPLKSGDTFVCKLRVEKEGRIKIVFYQEIQRNSDQRLMTRSKFTVACVKNGRPIEPIEILNKMGLTKA
jgi:acyl-CoA thioester hydrolase